MNAGIRRRLVVIADDYGIGPDTSAGILELARKGIVTGSVLLVNSGKILGIEAPLWSENITPMILR